MLKMSNFRRAMFVQHANELELYSRCAEPQHVADAQRDATCDALVVHVGAVGAVVLDDGLPVAAHDRAVRFRQARDARRQRAGGATHRRADQPSVSGSAVTGQARLRNSTCVGTASAGTSARRSGGHLGRGVRRRRDGSRCTSASASGGRTITSRAASAPSAAAPRGSSTMRQSRRAPSRSITPGNDAIRCETRSSTARPAGRDACTSRCTSAASGSSAATSRARVSVDAMRAGAERHLGFDFAASRERPRASRAAGRAARCSVRRLVHRVEASLAHELRRRLSRRVPG